jgi:hypothetical protein
MESKILTISPDMKAASVTDAQAMKLSAGKFRQNAVDRKDWSPDRKETNMAMADDLESAADKYLTLDNIPARGVGGEFIQQTGDKSSVVCPPREKIDRVNTDASFDRLELIQKNGVLNMALDVAEAVGASNAAEQMVAHQMAATHRMSLDLMAEAANVRDPIEKCRLANTAAKLMDTCQKGLLTINKVRNGGQQVMTVQHVHVTDCGQAVINGSVDTRGAGKK